jgi:hypothetical protein
MKAVHLEETVYNIVTELIKTFAGNGSVNTSQHAII